MPHRHELLARALRSLDAQTLQDFTVMGLPDGPDPLLEVADDVRVVPLGRHYSIGWGAVQRPVAGYLCDTEYIAYLDDDNEYLPHHLQTLMDAIGDKDMVFSQMLMPDGSVLFDGEVRVGKIDSSVILHRTDAL